MQDSDGANGGQVSPNSAMSISPASSEVGSCLVNGSTTASASALRSKKPGSTKESSNTSTSDFTKNSSSSSKKLIKGGNSTNSTRTSASGRSTGSNQQQPAGVDRSDLDLNWRQSSKASSKTLSADEDPNWRDHKTESNSKTTWAKTSKSKNSNNELGTYSKLIDLSLEVYVLH